MDLLSFFKPENFAELHVCRSTAEGTPAYHLYVEIRNGYGLIYRGKASYKLVDRDLSKFLGDAADILRKYKVEVFRSMDGMPGDAKETNCFMLKVKNKADEVYALYFRDGGTANVEAAGTALANLYDTYQAVGQGAYPGGPAVDISGKWYSEDGYSYLEFHKDGTYVSHAVKNFSGHYAVVGAQVESQDLIDHWSGYGYHNLMKKLPGAETLTIMGDYLEGSYFISDMGNQYRYFIKEGTSPQIQRKKTRSVSMTNPGFGAMPFGMMGTSMMNNMSMMNQMNQTGSAPAQSEETVTCPCCHKQVPKAKFCGECGAKLS